MNDDLTDQVENIRRAQQHLAKVWEKDHGETISGAPSDVVCLLHSNFWNPAHPDIHIHVSVFS